VSAAKESLLGGFSPDGKFLVYAVPNRPPSTPGGIFVVATDGSQESALVEGLTGDRFPDWTPDGTKVVFVSDRSGSAGLWSISVRDGKPASQPALLRGNLGPIDGLGFASDGTYFYGSLNLRQNVYWAGVDPATAAITSPASPLVDSLGDEKGSARWSPDGRLLSFVRTRQADASIMIRSADGSERILVAKFRTDVDATPSWFPDGRSLLVSEIDRTSRRSTFRRVPVDSGQSSVALDGPNWERRGLIGPSPDGKAVYYTKVSDTHDPSVPAVPGGRLVRRDLETGIETELYRTGNYTLFFSAAISPDGNRLAFLAGAGLMIVPTDGRTSPTEIARGPFLLLPAAEQSLVWSHDGRYVFVVGRDEEKGQRVWACPAAGGEPRKLDLAMEQIRLTDVSPDGRRLAFTGTQREPEIRAIRNLIR
jgi:Tol biopolymer transport system component